MTLCLIRSLIGRIFFVGLVRKRVGRTRRRRLQFAAKVRRTQSHRTGALDPAAASARRQSQPVLVAAAHRLPEGLRGVRRAAAQARRTHRHGGAHVLSRLALSQLRGEQQVPVDDIRRRRRLRVGRAAQHQDAECRVLCDRWRSDWCAEHFVAENGGAVVAVPREETVAAFGLRTRCVEVCATVGDYALGGDQSDQGRVLSDSSGRVA